MITVQILEADDIVLSSDWCRPLVLRTMSGGHSDSISDKNPYSGRPENNVQWVRVDAVFGKCWFGKPLHTLNTELHMAYEICRGSLPADHCLTEELY